jgi:hypothetical protein
MINRIDWDLYIEEKFSVYTLLLVTPLFSLVSLTKVKVIYLSVLKYQNKKSYLIITPAGLSISRKLSQYGGPG